MAIRLPKYEEIPRQPIGPTTPTYPRVGERFMSQYRYQQKSADIQQRQIDVTRKYSNIQFGIQLFKAGADLITTFGGMWAEQQQKIKAAERAADVNDASMETIKGFTDLMDNLGGQTVPAEYLQGRQASGMQFPTEESTYRGWYTQEADKLYRQYAEHYSKALTDPEAQAAYKSWLDTFYTKAYGDFAAGGMDRDATIATQKAYKNLREAVELNDWKMYETLIDSNVRSGVFSAERGEQLRSVVPGIKLERAKDRARAMGEAGPAYLVSEAAQEAFDITPEQGQAAAKEMQQDIELSKTYDYYANQEKILNSYDQAIADVDAGKLNEKNYRDVYDDEKYYLDPSRESAILGYLKDKVAAKQAGLQTYKEEQFTLIGDMIEAGDLKRAEANLNALQAHPGIIFGPQDASDFERYRWMIDNAGQPGDRDEYTNRVLEFESRIAHKQATWEGDFDPFVEYINEGDFGKQGEDKVGYFREQMEQLDKFRQDQSEKDRIENAAKSPSAREHLDYYKEVMTNKRETHTKEDLINLRNYVSDNTGPDPVSLEQRIKDSDSRWMVREINRRISELDKAGYKAADAFLKPGRDFIDNWFDVQLKPKQEELQGGVNKRRQRVLLEEIGQLEAQRADALMMFDERAPQGDNPYETATALVLPMQLDKIRDNLTGAKRWETRDEYYKRIGVPELTRGPGMAEDLPPLEEIISPETPSVLEARRARATQGLNQTVEASARQDAVDAQLLEKLNTYQLTQDGLDIWLFPSYQGQAAAPGMAWVWNRATQQAEQISIDEAARYGLIKRKRQ